MLFILLLHSIGGAFVSGPRVASGLSGGWVWVSEAVRTRPATACADPATTPHARLTLIRHGQSEWNLANRFTGWVDVDLTERGITEARKAGRLLKADGFTHDLVCTSTLRRAIRTACLVLSGTDQCWVPLVKDVRLNEQHSGMLTGNNKRELAEEFGVDQVMKWRRTYDDAPPPLKSNNPFQSLIRTDERYRGPVVGAAGGQVEVPSAESLRDTCERVASFYEDTVAPALRDGKNVVVVAHGNSLRALVKLLDGVSDDESFHLDLPTACPVVYDLDEQLRPMVTHGFWGTSAAARQGRYLMSEARVLRAQDAMRSQVVKNIAVSTVLSGPNPNDEVAICDAWTADSASDGVVADEEGREYNVRQRPPSYFSLESERIKMQALSELAGMPETPDEDGFGNSFVNNGNQGFLKRFEAFLEGGAAAVREGTGLGMRRVKPVRCKLIVLRHGFSEYNSQNRFTGWADVELSNRGREEARLAGAMLRQAGVRRLERVYSSYLKRAIKTAWLMLDELELQWVPIVYDWRLNERHYGALQGREKRECSEAFGVKQVQKWRRGVHHPPPPWDAMTAAATIDRRYEGIEVPESESLAQCAARLLPFVNDELRPAMREAMERVQREAQEADGAVGDTEDDVPTFVIASSENLIRALVAEIDGLSDDEVPLLDIPYAAPLVFSFDEDLTPVRTQLAIPPLQHGYYLGDTARIAEVQRDIRNSIVTSVAPREPGAEGEETTCFVATDEGERWVCDDAEEAAAATAEARVGSWVGRGERRRQRRLRGRASRDEAPPADPQGSK